jgi:hypothetical protein
MKDSKNKFWGIHLVWILAAVAISLLNVVLSALVLLYFAEDKNRDHLGFPKTPDFYSWVLAFNIVFLGVLYLAGKDKKVKIYATIVLLLIEWVLLAIIF